MSNSEFGNGSKSVNPTDQLRFCLMNIIVLTEKVVGHFQSYGWFLLQPVSQALSSMFVPADLSHNSHPSQSGQYTQFDHTAQAHTVIDQPAPVALSIYEKA